jgi:hypothetical protein
MKDVYYNILVHRYRVRLDVGLALPAYPIKDVVVDVRFGH